MANTNNLSPFELKDQLINIASSHKAKLMLNAGRGNPNFLALTPRYAFLQLGHFALKESERSYSYLQSPIGGMVEKQGLVERFDRYADINIDKEGVKFLKVALSFITDHLGIQKVDFLHEITEAFLGCNYPVPPKMLTICEQIVKIYLSSELCGTSVIPDDFEIFATEGGTAAMTYIFQTLKSNGLISKGDKIGIVTPIFSPYLEIPEIPEYSLEIVDIRADETQGWQITDEELKKLEDKKIKLLCVVNPSNPPSVKINEEVLNKISNLIRTKRRDLMIITDDVYSTFSDNFTSLFSKCPYNTLCVYSFSKYFGATGWRLGTIGLHANNVFDDALKNLDESVKKELDIRYQSLTTEPRKVRFIDRIVADSRTVALNHTAGISTPQQVQMTLFALSCILDENNIYKETTKKLIRRRYKILYQAIGVKIDNTDSNFVDYYTLIDLELLAKNLYNDDFAKWFINKDTGIDFLMRLADETSIVLLPGKGFEVVNSSVRVSLANLTEYEYKSIGKAIRKILDEYHDEFIKS